MSLPDRFHISWRNNAAIVKDSNDDWVNVTLNSTVAAETAYPLSNCQDSTPNKPTVFDMTGQTSVVITDLNSPNVARAVNCAAAQNANWPAGTTIRWEFFSDINQAGTTVKDTTAISVEHIIPLGSSIAGVDPLEGKFESLSRMRTHKSLWFDTVNCKSFRLTITNSAGFTNDLLSVDKIWCGYAHSFESGPEIGYTSTIVDPSEHQRKPGGGVETIEDYPYRVLSLEFKGMSNAHRHVMRNILDSSAKSGDVLITTDPNDVRSMNYETTCIARRTTDIGFIAQFYNWNDMGVIFEEN